MKPHHKSVLTRLLYLARDLRSRRLFQALKTHARGDILDVGGWDFFVTAAHKQVHFATWTVLEVERQSLPIHDDKRVRLVIGDGTRMMFDQGTFDTVLNIQVLEHVFEPNLMVEEQCRVLKSGGHLVMMVPQTSNLHMAPHHYYNFTRYWVQESLRRNNMEIVEYFAIGGAWSSMSSRLLHSALQMFGLPGTTTGTKRPPLFYVLALPMLLFTAIAVPIGMLLSLGDMEEEANNHLVIARKR
jgi:SAM-dependent methyltransferase